MLEKTNVFVCIDEFLKCIIQPFKVRIKKELSIYISPIRYQKQTFVFSTSICCKQTTY